MARSSPMWWPWVQRGLDERGWTPARLAHEIRTQLGYGPDESTIGRWKNKGSAPTRESVRAVAAVFRCDVRKALRAAEWIDLSQIDLSLVPDEVLEDEVYGRQVRRRRGASPQCQPAVVAVTANGANHSTTATTSGASRHVVSGAETTTVPPSSGEDEGTGLSIDASHCA